MHETRLDEGVTVFRIELATANAAFAEIPAGQEIARILRELADKLEDPSMTVALEDGTTTGTVRDYNGNTVGQWMHTAE